MRFNKSMLAKSLMVLALTGVATSASAAWKYGIGTGMSGISYDGDISLGTKTPLGTLLLPIDLSPSDVKDFTDSAFGFAGYATDGNLVISYGYGNLNLKDTIAKNNVGATIKLDLTKASLNAAYPIYQAGNLKLSVVGGVVYVAHDLSIKFFAVSDENLSYKASGDNNWLDAKLGLNAQVKLAPEWVWASSFDVTAGQSEGTYSVSTGVVWTPYKNWTFGLSSSYSDVEFTENDKNDTDYYNYDMEETVVGLSVMYNF